MGKFERGEAEKLERNVVLLLNNKNNKKIQLYNLHKCAPTVARHLQKDFNNTIDRAEFVGRRYNEPADIKLYLINKKVAYIELKLLRSGKGTRANISQNALTDLGLFCDNNVKSWQQYREETNFKQRVLSILNSYKWYDKSELSRIREVNELEKKAIYLRKLLNPHKGESIENAVKRSLASFDPKIREAAKIVHKILDLARIDKINYIQYLRNLCQNSEKIKRFVIVLLLGFHKVNDIKKMMNDVYFNELINSLMRGDFIYRAYYVYKSNCRVVAEDLTPLILKLLKSSNYRIVFPVNQTNVVIEFRDPEDGEWKRILRIVFHWKNIFQGIKTPCLNIFDEGILKQ